MRNKSGFTIIEILMVLVITSTFMIFGVSRYREFSRRQEVVVAKRNIITDLRQAQKDAISGRKPLNINGQSCEGTLLEYSLEIDITSNNSYEIKVICADPLGGADVEILLKTVDLSANIILTPPPSNPIAFKPFTLATNIPNTPPGFETIVINSGVADSTQIVTINWTGEIK